MLISRQPRIFLWLWEGNCLFFCCMQTQQFCMVILIYLLLYFSGQQPLVSSLCLMMQRPKPDTLNHYVNRENLTYVLHMQLGRADFILSSGNNCGSRRNNIKNCLPKLLDGIIVRYFLLQFSKKKKLSLPNQEKRL